ncbi:MAG: hypothetical protein K9I85_15685 [Saprospiraceae bacterium]|nr:hypothetical protein [Saprospiraceae bacterium]
MKTLQYFSILVFAFVFHVVASAQSDGCDTRLYNFNPDIQEREIPIPPTAPPAPPLGPNGEEKRTIYFLHGLGGDEGSLANASTYTLNLWSNNVSTELISYAKTQYSSFNVAAGTVFSVIDPKIKNDPEETEKLRSNFIIAHSMGGLIGRKVDQMFEEDGETVKPYGGLVTFGSPHLGSNLADLKANNPEAVEHFINLTCTSLLSGPTTEFIKKTGLTRWIDRFAFWTNAGDWIADLACDKISGILFDFAQMKFTMPIEASLAPGSTDLQEIADYPPANSNLHTVAFYGEEHDDNEDLAIRFLFSIVHNPLEYPLMKADQMDDDALEDANKIRDEFIAKEKYWRKRAKNKPFGDWFSKKYYSQGDMYDLANSFLKGVLWFDNLNNRWKTMIGALDMLPNGNTNCFCSCSEYNPSGPAFEFVNPISCSEDCSIYEDFYINCTGFEEPELIGFNTTSDGLVIKESAIAFPNAKYPPLRMVGSGHMQMKNDSQLKSALNALYNGDVNTYFKLAQ